MPSTHFIVITLHQHFVDDVPTSRAQYAPTRVMQTGAYSCPTKYQNNNKYWAIFLPSGDFLERVRTDDPLRTMSESYRIATISIDQAHSASSTSKRLERTSIDSNK